MKASEFITLLVAGIAQHGDRPIGILNLDSMSVALIDGVDLGIMSTPAGIVFTIDAIPLAEPLVPRVPRGAPFTW